MPKIIQRSLLPLAVWLAAFGTQSLFAAQNAAPAPQDAAAKVDALLSAELPGVKSPAAADEVFLRRLALDLVGQTPSSDDVLAFAFDEAPDKRQKLIQKLLADPRFGENWAAYWRDVILFRRTEDRALLSAGALQVHLAERFNQNTPWSEIASSFVTANGDVSENGATALIMAQEGRPEETVAEISRIFLGIQIQCAQCHNHPTDRWRREEFHHLAAFFPRVAVRPDQSGDRRTFLVVAQDQFPRFAPRNAMNRFRGSAEHRMPDLEKPEEPGNIMEPIFFVSGEKLPLGATDADRRGTLAKWMTSAENPWFSKAFVNRLWGELVGEGFYEPLDDLGPDRQATAPQTLDYLAAGFTQSGYDVKWLYETIALTEAYQRQSGSRRQPDAPSMQANVWQRLRADQLYDNLAGLVGMPAGLPGQAGRGPYGLRRGPEVIFQQVFGYDPSEPRDEISGSIPQALALMNSPLIENGVASPRGKIASLLAEVQDNKQAVAELYLEALSREPTAAELRIALEHVRTAENRKEAFEDLLWALVNSSEFMHRK